MPPRRRWYKPSPDEGTAQLAPLNSRRLVTFGEGARIGVNKLYKIARLAKPAADIKAASRQFAFVSGVGARANVVATPRIYRWLVQREPVERDDFFPGQLAGGASAHRLS